MVKLVTPGCGKRENQPGGGGQGIAPEIPGKVFCYRGGVTPIKGGVLGRQLGWWGLGKEKK